MFMRLVDRASVMKTCALSSLASFLRVQSRQKFEQFSASLSFTMLTILGCNMLMRLVARTHDTKTCALSSLAGFLKPQPNKALEHHQLSAQATTTRWKQAGHNS